MRVFAALAREVSHLGVRTGFALMSEEIAQLMVELDRQGVALFLSRHEAGAVGMADGFGRAAGSPAIAVIGRGPGLTNALTALTTAARAGTPLLVLAGASSADGRGQPDPKQLGQQAMLAAAGIPHVTVSGAETAVSCLRAAHSRAVRGETVVVNLPVETLGAEIEDGEPGMPPPPSPVPPLDHSAVSLVADLLSETWTASRPVILAGRGAVRTGARRELIELADRTGSLLGTTLMANSLFAGHPFDIGVVGTFSRPNTAELISNADLVLAFGAALNPFTTYGGTLFGKARIAQFDADPKAFGRSVRPDIAVLGDARQAAAALLRELATRDHRSNGYRSPAVAERIQTARSAQGFVDRSRPGAIDPRTLMRALDKALPTDRVLVVDPGHHLTFSCTHLSVPSPDCFVFPVDFGAVGSATSVALGVAIARRRSTTVLAIGDGGLMMALADLQTAARLGLRLVVVVSNDSGFGAEVHYLDALGLPDELARYQNPSFEHLGRVLGFDAVTVTSVEDISRLRDRLGNVTRPVLLDCRVVGEVRADWIEFYYLGKR